MNDLKYEPIAFATERDLQDRLESVKSEIVAEALHAVAKRGEDWKSVQDTCLAALTSPRLPIRWAAATCLGDLALLRRRLDTGVVIAALEKACEDPAIADPARFSLSMVKQLAAR